MPRAEQDSRVTTASRDARLAGENRAQRQRGSVVGFRPRTFGIPPRRTHPADVAQARLFDELLQVEIAEATELVASAERQWRRRCEGGTDSELHPPEALTRLRDRVLAAERLRDALRTRFLLE
jgi:hypothetical protein